MANVTVNNPTAAIKEYVSQNKAELNNAGATQEVHNTGVERMQDFSTPGPAGDTATRQNNSTSVFPNELEQFATSNHIFTLSVLTSRQLSYPDKTYRAGQTVAPVLRSGGGLGDQKVKTVYEGSNKLEYFMDDVEIESIITPTGKQRATNATNIKFKIMEPYSMGLFLQTLQIAAAAEYKNYLETPMLLTVEFVGQNDDGEFIGGVAKRYYPLKLVSMDMNVTGGGTVYDVEAVPYNETGLTDNIQTMDTDIELTGTTLAELLDTGEQSLSKVVNDRFISQIDTGQAARPDEFIILFPDDVAGTKGQAGGAGDGSVSETQSAMYDLTAQDLPPRVTVDTSQLPRGNSASDREAIRASTQQFIAAQSSLTAKLRENLSGSPNKIGQAKMIQSIDDAGNNPLNKAGLSYNGEKQIFENDKMSVSADLRTYSFPRGSKVQDIIEELVIISDYGRRFAEPKADENGFVDWFKIETEVYPITNIQEQSRTGKNPKVYIYKVVPYKAHLATISNPTASPPSISRLRANAAKQYDYIYTGLNNDILDFEINLNNQFFAAVSADGDALSKDSVNKTSQGTSATGQTQMQSGTNNGGSGAQGTVQFVPQSTTGSGGGGGAETVESRVARTFNDAIVNSNVDLLTLNFTIMGDPYYLADSGMGNYNSRKGTLNVTADGTMDYQRSEVDIIVNFRTPIDYNDEEGDMIFPQETIEIEEFSGLYKVLQVTSNWSGGKFTQEIQCIRRRNQEKTYLGNSVLKQNQSDKSELDESGRASGSHSSVNSQKKEGNPSLKEQMEQYHSNRLEEIKRGNVSRGF